MKTPIIEAINIISLFLLIPLTINISLAQKLRIVRKKLSIDIDLSFSDKNIYEKFIAFKDNVFYSTDYRVKKIEKALDTTKNE